MVLRKQQFFLMLIGVSVIGLIMTGLTSGKRYPACDNSASKAALAALYDNRRLLHAIDVSGFTLLSDGLKGRYCTAKIKWDNGLQTEVSYKFFRSGRQSQYLSMWIDYNGGMRGPSF